MSNLIRILILEDRASDAELIVEEVRSAGFNPCWERVETEQDYVAHLTPELDLIIADYNLSGFDGLSAMRLLKASGLNIPFILVSASSSEERAVKAMQDGAADYLLNDRFARLGLTVTRALEQKRLRAEARCADQLRRDSEKRFRGLIEISSDAIVQLDADATVHYASPASQRILGGAEDNLAASEAQLRALFAAMTDVVIVHDSEGRYLQIAPTNPVHLFKAPHEVIGRTMHEVLPTAEADYILDHIRLALEKQETSHIEYRLPIRGVEYWFNATISPLSADKVILIARDITEGRRTEEALRESELRYRMVTQLASDYAYAYRIEPGGKAILEWVTEAYARITGYAPAELQTASAWQRIVHPDDQAHAMEYVERIERGEGSTCEYRIITKQGDVHWLYDRAEPMYDETTGQVIRVFGAAQDISERKRAELQIARRAEEFAALYNTASALGAEPELSSILEIIVEAAAQLLGVTTTVMYSYDLERHDLELVVAKNFPIPLGMRLRMGEGMSGKVAETREPLRVDDYRRSPYRPAKYQNLDFSAVLSVPLLYTGGLVGVLSVAEMNTSTRKFTEADARLLSLFASQAAGAVHNARLLQETRTRAEQLALLYDAGLALNSVLEPRAQLEFLFNIAIKTLHAQRATFYRWNEDRRELKFEVGVGLDPETANVLRNRRWALDSADGLGVMESVVTHRVPLKLADVSQDSRWIGLDKSVRSGLLVPVEHENQLLGLLAVSSDRLNAFTLHDERLLVLFANQAAVALTNARLFSETIRLYQEMRRRVAELEVLNRVSTTLRVAPSLDEMLPSILDETLAVLNAHIGSIWLYEPALDAVHLTIRRDWSEHSPTLLKRGQGIPGHVLETGKVYFARALKSDPQVFERTRASIPDRTAGGACVPLRSGNDFSGVLFIIVEAPRELTPADVQLLETLAEVAGSAIHRMRLYEQTEQQLEHLAALRAIDRAIGGSVDLRITLNILLQHVVAQLGVDAACVLLNSATGTLEYAAGRGFRTRGIERSSVRLGEGLAGHAAFEGRMIAVPNVAASPLQFAQPQLLSGEEFVACYAVPLISKGHVHGVLEVFHRTSLDPTPAWLEFLEALAGQAAIAIDNATLFQYMQRSNIGLALAYDATIEGWSRALDLRDKETEGHTQRVTEVTLKLARTMELSDTELVHVRRGALLHDIGKMGIPDQILFKPGPLTEEEWEIMRRHPVYAYELLAPIEYLRPALDIPHYHHEKWDGTGYPRGLKGEHIPLGARIFAVVDVWDALRSDRPYRAAWDEDRVLNYIRDGAGTHFDPSVVEAFLRSISEQDESSVERLTHLPKSEEVKPKQIKLTVKNGKK